MSEKWVKLVINWVFLEICWLSAWWLWLYRLESVAPTPKSSSNCWYGLVFDSCKFEVIDRRLFLIEVNWPDKVFKMKSMESLINWAARWLKFFHHAASLFVPVKHQRMFYTFFTNKFIYFMVLYGVFRILDRFTRFTSGGIEGVLHNFLSFWILLVVIRPPVFSLMHIESM
jgi:hypothetical protein